MNKQLLAAATLLAFVTVMTLTFYPTDSAYAAHCSAKEAAYNSAAVDAAAKLAKAWALYAKMVSKIGQPGFWKAAYDYAKAAWAATKAVKKAKDAKKAWQDCENSHSG